MNPLEFFKPVVQNTLDQLNSSNTYLTGLPGGSKSLFLLTLALHSKKPLAVITQEDLEADGLIVDLEAWSSLLPSTQRPPLLLFPEIDAPSRIAALGQWTQTHARLSWPRKMR
jgi:hypothetical protein